MAEDETPATGKVLTGRKVLMIFVGAFAVIIGVNFFMAYSAIGTFPGLEVKNSYVASQSFEADRAAQEALGWEASAEIDGASIKLEIIGLDGKPALLDGLVGTLGRATQRTDDQELVFGQNSLGAHVAPINPVDIGKWDLRFVATSINGTEFRQRIEIIVPES